jgi:hypothetical protein
MSANLNPLPALPASILETDIFGLGEELAFSKTKAKTLDVGRVPTISQAAFLAGFCLTLYWRSPRFQQMADNFSDYQAYNDFEKKVLYHHSLRTLVLSVQGSVEAVRDCVFQFIEAVGTERFWTSDAPCWMWHREGDGYNKKILEVAGEFRICPPSLSS